MRFVLLAGCFLLTSCAAQQPIYKPVSVDVPVRVECHVPEIPKPNSPLQQIQIDAPLFDKVKAALIEIDNRKIYEAEVEAALQSCR